MGINRAINSDPENPDGKKMDLQKPISNKMFYGVIAVFSFACFGLIYNETGHIIYDYQEALNTDAQTIEMLSAK